MLDLDNFKPINDTHGHQVGDDFLKAISQMLGSQFSKYDFFARYAGDEFVALVNQIDESQCAQMVEQLQRAVEQFAFCVRPMKYVQVGVSVGAAMYGQDGTTLDALLISADRAMYCDKHDRKLRKTGTDGGNVIYMPSITDGARPS
jgi:diguanylate cyclase (GGDEF)-like protein